MKNSLTDFSKKWLITGVAGFIGSNLLKKLLSEGVHVIGIDNFSTGRSQNLESVKMQVGSNWSNFSFYEEDVSEISNYNLILKDVDVVVHLAALGSIPRSIANPLATNQANISGFLNTLNAAKEAEIKQFIFASSSSVYGDNQSLPKYEDEIGKPLSPYAFTKLANEIYAEIYYKIYGYSSIGLRFFNVFGPLQNPDGEYAAVIPRWLDAMINNHEVIIFGDGKTTRDFCYIDNAVDAILLSSNSQQEGFYPVNIAFSEKNSLLDIAHFIKDELAKYGIYYSKEFIFQDFRPGDIKDSLASITKAKDLIGYLPKFSCYDGLSEFIKFQVNIRN